MSVEGVNIKKTTVLKLNWTADCGQSCDYRGVQQKMDFKVCMNTGCIRSTQYTLSVRFVFNMEKGGNAVGCVFCVLPGRCAVQDICTQPFKEEWKREGCKRSC